MNRNTRHARKLGYCSLHDLNTGGNKITKGGCVDTAWNNKNSNKRSKKTYGRSHTTSNLD
jgi:hypothetical protein